MQILIEHVKADQKCFIAANMDLTHKEAKEFWHLYEGYQQELGLLNGNLSKLINE